MPSCLLNHCEGEQAVSKFVTYIPHSILECMFGWLSELQTQVANHEPVIGRIGILRRRTALTQNGCMRNML